MEALALVLVLALFVLFPLIGAYLRSPTVKGARGERRVNSILDRQLPSGKYKVFHDVTLHTSQGPTQIDHIVVSRYGVFVVETKNYTGWIFGDEVRCAYMAMCSLFLPRERAWLVNTYSEVGEWKTYGIAGAAGELTRNGFDVRPTTGPVADERNWLATLPGGLATDREPATSECGHRQPTARGFGRLGGRGDDEPDPIPAGVRGLRPDDQRGGRSAGHRGEPDGRGKVTVWAVGRGQ